MDWAGIAYTSAFHCTLTTHYRIVSYPTVIKWRYVHSFWQNSRTWHITDRQTDRHTEKHTNTAWWHKPSLCIASRGKNRDSPRISDPLLLEVTCYQQLNGTSDCVDAWYTNAALSRINGLAFVTDDIAAMHLVTPKDIDTKRGASKQASNFIRQNNEKIQIYCWIMNIIHLAGCQWSLRLS